MPLEDRTRQLQFGTPIFMEGFWKSVLGELVHVTTFFSRSHNSSSGLAAMDTSYDNLTIPVPLSSESVSSGGRSPLQAGCGRGVLGMSKACGYSSPVKEDAIRSSPGCGRGVQAMRVGLGDGFGNHGLAGKNGGGALVSSSQQVGCGQGVQMHSPSWESGAFLNSPPQVGCGRGIQALRMKERCGYGPAKENGEAGGTGLGRGVRGLMVGSHSSLMAMSVCAECGRGSLAGGCDPSPTLEKGNGVFTSSGGKDGSAQTGKVSEEKGPSSPVKLLLSGRGRGLLGSGVGEGHSRPLPPLRGRPVKKEEEFGSAIMGSFLSRTYPTQPSCVN